MLLIPLPLIKGEGIKGMGLINDPKRPVLLGFG